MASLARTGATVLKSEADPIDKPAEPTEATLKVKLEDEQFDYNSEEKKKRPVKRERDTNQATTKGGYLSVEKPKEEIRLSDDFKTEQSAQTFHPNVDGDTSHLFYWFDAKEQPYHLTVDPGSIFLFGKKLCATGPKTHYASCCVRVRNVERVLYLLPKPGSSESEVVAEINSLCRAQSIEQRKIKFVERYYTFEDTSIPRGKGIWAELRFPGKYPPLTIKSGRHIASVIGSSYSLLELFLLSKKIMGPCFLDLGKMTPASIRISHCEEEYIIDNPDAIEADTRNLSPPPLTLCSIQLHSQLDSSGSASEIIIVSMSVFRNVNLEGNLRSTADEIHTGIRPVEGGNIPIDLETFCSKKGFSGVQRFTNEVQLLRWCATKLGSIDADFLVGHNVLGFTVNTLLRRYQDLNVSNWSTIGRLDLKKFPRLHGLSTAQEKEVCVGRLVVDSYLLSREYFKSVNYKLSALADQMGIRGFAEGTSDFEPGVSVITPEVQANTQSLFKCLIQIGSCTIVSTGVVSHLDAIRLTKRLCTIAGNLWSHTLYGGRSERIEYLLLHTFYGLGFILPDKKPFENKRNREDEEGDEKKKKGKYQGGMVLDPKCGLYSDYILLLDFNSLYPSLIQEFKICFTTVEQNDEEVPTLPSESLVCDACAEKGVTPPCLHKCVLPKVIKSLVDSRREVKRLMKTEKDPNNLALLEIRQKALKLTANSMYGCLGFEHSRFYAQKLAELTTQYGRDALQKTVDLIPQINPSLRVIYGDTDSVMIQTGIKNDIRSVRDLGLEIKTKVNKGYQSLEIDIDGVFRAMLLLKKKKYAALTVVDWEGEGKVIKKEVKGLDMVRRDWCPLSKKVSDAVLNRILNADGGEDILDYIVSYMKDVAEHVRIGDRYTLDDYVISKSLTKEPESYRGSTFPHASVALRMKERKEMVRVGDLIPYVICTGSDKLSEKAYHVEEMRKSSSLQIDAEWYLSSQLYPPVLRLCEHIQGFSDAQLSEAMGIVYHGNSANRTDLNDDGDANPFSHCGLFKSTETDECFPAALPLQVACTHCRRLTPINPHKRVLDYLANTGGAPQVIDLYVCASCNKSLPVDYLANCLTQTMDKFFRQFYQSGGGKSSVDALRNQFTYFRALFDVPHAPGCPPPVKRYHLELTRRCIGLLDRKLYTLQESEQPETERQEPVDPLQASSDGFYKRIANLYVNLGNLF
ncbi:DNA polymerase alpha subunit A [Angomonas deanei]|nr:DNA polymerase alpha subunit A [Angomonas deanei]|eukprot:EPY32897.1 DNA polymerase alpha subunit A [Angomonas deanei]